MRVESERRRTRLWTAAALGVSLPLVFILCTTLWFAPYPISDSIGHFEDAVVRPTSSFLFPTSSYYRPLFYMTLAAVWKNASSMASALTIIRFFHIVPIALLVLLLVSQMRPRRPIDAAAAMLGVAVLIGSPGFRDNLELPLSYTIVGMPAALAVWMLLERTRRWWHGGVIVALTLLALGFKEQGLVIVPLVIAAWWLGAPGVGRGTPLVLVVVAIVYVLFRLRYHDPSLPMFEQDVGLGFMKMSAEEAEERFREFPLWIYAYSAASTIGNVLFAEPTEGIFRVVYALIDGPLQPWHVVHVLSSMVMTSIIIWWGIDTLRRRSDPAVLPEARLFVAMLVVLAATGLLSFNYSRDRLGGMAVPLYALSAYYALRAAAQRASAAAIPAAALTAVVLLLLGAGWQLRAIYTIEMTRQRVVNTEREWTTRYDRRRTEFSGRNTYTRMLEGMLEQGTDAAAIRRTRYPRWLVRTIGEY